MVRIKMKFDVFHGKSGYYSGETHNVSSKIAKELTELGKASYYDKNSASRLVKIGNTEITWGDYLKYKRKK